MKSQTSYHTGDIILITERKVSNKMQPNVKVGNFYEVENAGLLKSGSISLLCRDYPNGKHSHRINAERFVWDDITQEQYKAAEKRADEYEKQRLHDLCAKVVEAEENKFKQDCAESFELLQKNFGWEDHVQIAFVPLIISHIAWVYAEKTRKWCADHRISEVKKLSRAVQQVRQDYVEFLRKDLDVAHIANLERQTEEFLQQPEIAMHFTIIYYTLSNEFLRQHPNVSLMECRIYAEISMLMIDAYLRHNDRMNALIAGKLGNSESINNPFITEKLRACMDAYLGNFVLEKSENITIAEAIFDKFIASYDYQLTNS